MTPAQTAMLAQAHNRYNDPDAVKNEAGSGGLAALAQLKR